MMSYHLGKGSVYLSTCMEIWLALFITDAEIYEGKLSLKSVLGQKLDRQFKIFVRCKNAKIHVSFFPVRQISNKNSSFLVDTKWLIMIRCIRFYFAQQQQEYLLDYYDCWPYQKDDGWFKTLSCQITLYLKNVLYCINPKAAVLSLSEVRSSYRNT